MEIKTYQGYIYWWNIREMYVAWYDLAGTTFTMDSAWWMLMPWHQFGTRASATIMMMLANHHISHCSDITWVSWHLKSQTTWLFVQVIIQPNNRENIKALYYFLKVIYRSPVRLPSQRAAIITGPMWGEPLVTLLKWPVDSPHKAPVMWTTFPCHNTILSNIPT